MTEVNLRLRAWARLVRRMAPIATMTEAQVTAIQARRVPANP